MDATKIVNELSDSTLGDFIRQQYVETMISDLVGHDDEDEREWADSVIEWLRASYL